MTPFSRAFEIHNTWSGLYLNHPEFFKKLKATFTGNQEEIFEKVSIGYEDCGTSFIINGTKTEECVTNMIKIHNTEEIDELINVIHKVKKDLPEDEVQDVTMKYVTIFEIFTGLVKKKASFFKSIKNFTEDERNFLSELIAKVTHHYLHLSDINVRKETAKFFKDNELLRQVYEKMIEINRALN